MSNIVTKSVVSLADFKANIKAVKLSIVKSDRTEKLYAKNGDKIVASCAKDLNMALPMVVHHMYNDDNKEEWFFLTNETSYTSIGDC